MDKRVDRLFPRRTNATPDDALAFVCRSPPRDLKDIGGGRSALLPLRG
jgi:hypothetical protein